MPSRYDAFPGHGTVTKIKAGWPRDLPKDPIWWRPAHGNAWGIQALINIIASKQIQELIYQFWGEQRDVNIEFFRRVIQRRLKNSDPNWDEEDFEITVVEAARTGGSSDFTLVLFLVQI